MSSKQQYQIGDSLIFFWFKESNQMSGNIVEVHNKGNYTVKSADKLWVLNESQIVSATHNMNDALNAMAEL